jgi:hypothetical protein
MDALGTWDDTAKTDPTARGSGIALLKGILTAHLNGSVIDAAGNVLTVKYAVANVAAAQTDAAVIAAVTAKKIRVLALMHQAGATATVITYNSKPAGAGTAVSPAFSNPINGGTPLPFNPSGWFQTNSGEGLSATTGAGSTTGILVVYVEVP